VRIKVTTDDERRGERMKKGKYIIGTCVMRRRNINRTYSNRKRMEFRDGNFEGDMLEI